MPPSLRLGPLTWVPELRSAPGDPWAHRKGEPRPLALAWSIYLFIAAVATVLSVRSLTAPNTERFADAGRVLMLMILVGISVLWPMLRLSQEAPARPARALLGDLLAILVPAQAVIWPLILLARWPWPVVSALSVGTLSWALLSAGLLSSAYNWGECFPRWCAMAGCIALALAGPAVSCVIGHGQVGVNEWAYVSPLTMVWALTAAPTGLHPAMRGWEWALVVVPGSAGVLLWLPAGTLARRRVGV